MFTFIFYHDLYSDKFFPTIIRSRKIDHLEEKTDTVTGRITIKISLHVNRNIINASDTHLECLTKITGSDDDNF